MRWWKGFTSSRYLDRMSLSPLRHSEVLLIRNRVWLEVGLTWRDGRGVKGKGGERMMQEGGQREGRKKEKGLLMSAINRRHILNWLPHLSQSFVSPWCQRAPPLSCRRTASPSGGRKTRTIAKLTWRWNTYCCPPPEPSVSWRAESHFRFSSTYNDRILTDKHLPLLTLCQRSTGLLLRSHSPRELHLKHEDWQHDREDVNLKAFAWYFLFPLPSVWWPLTWCWCRSRPLWCWWPAANEVRCFGLISKLRTGDLSAQQHNLKTNIHI